VRSNINVRPIRDDMNFKRPCWLTLFISLGLILLGYVGSVATRPVFQLFHIHYDKLGAQDLVTVAFLFLELVGLVATTASFIWCLVSVVIFFRSRHAKKI
jgi:hypothetical protein